MNPKAAEPEPAKPGNLAGVGADFQSAEPELFLTPRSGSRTREPFSKFLTAKIGAGAFFELGSSGAFVHAHFITKQI